MRKIFVLFLMAAFAFSACNKQAISPNKLKGKTFEVTEWYYLTGSSTHNGGTNYNTWINTGEAYRVDFAGAEGTWDFSKDGEVTIDMSYQHTYNNQTSTVSFTQQGTLIMDGRQDFFDIDSPGDYQQYHIHEQKGRRIVIYWENLWNGSTGDVIFVTLER